MEELAVDRPSQRVDDQAVERGAGERLDVEPLTQPVLPQRHDGVGNVLPPPNGGHDPHPVLRAQLVRQRRGGLVEGVGIVDGQHGGGARQDGFPGPGQGSSGVVDGQQGGEGAERHGAGRPCRPHLQDAHPCVAGALDRFDQQPGLAHACLAREHDSPACCECRRDLVELCLAPDERRSELQPRDLLPNPRGHPT